MKKVLCATLVMAVSMLFASCGGGGSGAPGGGSSATAVAPATVGLVITDLSSNDYDHAWATVTSVTLIGGDDGHVPIFSGNEKVDLLSLRDRLHLFAVNGNVKPGIYSKIRLRVSELTLEKYEPDGSISVVHVTLVANGKVDLNPRGTFRIGSGEVVFVSFDWDIDKSLKFTETGKGNGKVIMRPVIFAHIGTEPLFKNGLVRMHGVVDSVAADLSSFRICAPLLVAPLTPQSVLNNLCVDVHVTGKTGVFGNTGLPKPVNTLIKGEQVTVLGLLRRTNQGNPAPIPLASGNIKPTPFQIVSIVVEAGPVGTWRQIRGVLKSTVDGAGQFGFDPDAGQGFSDTTLFTGKLFGESRIFRLDANTGITEVTPGALALDDRAIVDAVQVKPAVTGDPDVLNIAIMLSQSGASTSDANGKISSVSVGSGSLVLTTTSGDQCVANSASTKVFLLYVTADSVQSVQANFADLKPGSLAAVAGTDVNGCIAADVIVAEGQTGP